jgi:ectoine hydroxylase-related dioxygenase (phytanoyl-CoA dioxygenase family)
MNARPFPIGVQGVLSIKEQDIETGGFQAVPYLFQNFEEWVKTQPEDRDPICPDMTGLSRQNVDLSPGDLLIFNSLLAHGVRPNHSENRVRMAQYISMYPANQHNEEERKERVRLWNDIEPPARPDFPGDPRDWEKRSYGRAYLNPLGKKLLGLDLW